MPSRGDTFADHLLADETAHRLVADAGDEAGPQAEPRRADGDVGGAAADGLGEGRHVLEPPADLLAVEIDRGPADGDDVQNRLHAYSSSGRLRKLAIEPCRGA